MWTFKNLLGCSNKKLIALPEVDPRVEEVSVHLRAVVVQEVAEAVAVPLLEEEETHRPTRSSLHQFMIVRSQDNLRWANLQVMEPRFSSQGKISKCQPVKCKISE